MMCRVLCTVGLLVIAAAGAELDESSCSSQPPEAKQCQALLQQGRRSQVSVDGAGSDSDDIVKHDKKKAKHVQEPPPQGEEDKREKLANAAHDVRVLQNSLSAAEKTEEELVPKLMKLGEDLEHANANQEKVERQISTLQQALQTARETAESCIALSEAMKHDLQAEKAKIEKMKAVGDEHEDELAESRQQAVALQQRVNEIGKQLQDGDKVAQMAEQLQHELAAVNDAKDALAKKMQQFKVAMGSKISQVEQDNDELRRQIHEMEAKFESAEKAAAILRPYAGA